MTSSTRSRWVDFTECGELLCGMRFSLGVIAAFIRAMLSLQFIMEVMCGA